MIVKVMKEVGFGETCGASLSSYSSMVDNNGADSQTSLDQVVHTKIAFWDNITSCLTKMMEEMNNQTKQQDYAIMMQFLDYQTQIQMAKNYFGVN